MYSVDYTESRENSRKQLLPAEIEPGSQTLRALCSHTLFILGLREFFEFNEHDIKGSKGLRLPANNQFSFQKLKNQKALILFDLDMTLHK